MDPRAQQARQHHNAASAEASWHRAERDRLIVELSRDGYGYRTLARMVGCSWELVRAIVKAAQEQ